MMNGVVPAIGLTKARVDIANQVNMAQGPRVNPAIRLPPGMRALAANDSGRGNL